MANIIRGGDEGWEEKRLILPALALTERQAVIMVIVVTIVMIENREGADVLLNHWRMKLWCHAQV